MAGMSLLGFFVTSLGPLKSYVGGMKKVLRGPEAAGAPGRVVQELVEVLEALILEEGACDFADSPEDFPEISPMNAEPLPSLVWKPTQLNHSLPRFVRTSEGFIFPPGEVLAVIPPSAEGMDWLITVAPGSTFRLSVAEGDALTALLAGMTVPLVPCEVER